MGNDAGPTRAGYSYKMRHKMKWKKYSAPRDTSKKIIEAAIQLEPMTTNDRKCFLIRHAELRKCSVYSRNERPRNLEQNHRVEVVSRKLPYRAGSRAAKRETSREYEWITLCFAKHFNDSSCYLWKNWTRGTRKCVFQKYGESKTLSYWHTSKL